MKRQFAFATLFCFSIYMLNSCSKSGNNNTVVPPVVIPDTITNGWSKILIPANHASDIFFNNPTNGYAIMDSLYKSTDGGLSWTKLNAPYGNLINMAVTSDGKLFIVGYGNTIYRSIDGGTSFSSINTNNPGLTDIYFIDNNTGFTGSSTGLYQTTDGGVTWPLVITTGLSINSGSYSSFYFINASTGWVSTGGNIFKTNGNINNWTMSNFTGAVPGNTVLSLFGVSSSIVFSGATDGNIFKSIDGGANFSIVTILPKGLGGNGGYLDLHFLSATTGYACYANRIYKTTDGGTNWVKVVSLGSGFFTEIHFTDANHGWGCASGGQILRYFQ